MLRRVLSFAFILGILGSSLGQEAPIDKPQAAPLLPILEVLDKAKVSGSLVFSGRCIEGYTPDFPQFRDSRASGSSPLESLRETLPAQSVIQLTQDRNQLIRMIEPGVPTDVLNVRISHVSFGTAIYNPDVALTAIFRAPEVVAFVRAHDFKRPLRTIGGGGGGVTGNPSGRWPPEHPRISGSLDNVTVSEALDHILGIFPGVWVYENCPGSGSKNRDIYFGFFYLDKTGLKPIVVE